jgi:hypothetical protein
LLIRLGNKVTIKIAGNKENDSHFNFQYVMIKGLHACVTCGMENSDGDLDFVTEEREEENLVLYHGVRVFFFKKKKIITNYQIY